MYETEIANDDQNRLDLLIEHAKHNQAEAQQLALDASRLLGISSERFDEFKDKGFFKRCWYKISGKHGDLLRANQADLIEMQKFSWYYLMKLQEQNLIEAQSIAVIRNNLQELASATLETRVAIVRLVEKFDHRIVKLEEVTAIHDWLISIKVKGYDRYPELHRMLRVVFDYFKIIQEKGIAYERIEGRKDIEAALHELSVDYKRELTLAEFVSQLLDEIMEIGFDQFRDLIKIMVAGNSVDSAFILENVSGSGYNSIYIVEHELPHIKNVVQHIEDGKSQSIIIRSLQSIIVNSETKYSLIELAKEILTGSIIANEIYLENNKITSQETLVANHHNDFSIESLFGNSISINYHALTHTSPSKEECVAYLESFAVIFAATGEFSNKQRLYISSIANYFGRIDCIGRIDFLLTTPHKLKVDKILSILNSDERQYTWIIDAVFLSTIEGFTHKAENAILTMGKAMNIKQDTVSECIRHAKIIALDDAHKNILASIRFFTKLSRGWATILDFRKFSFQGAFDDLWDELHKPLDSSVFRMRLSFTSDRSEAWSAAGNYGFQIGNEGFFMRNAQRLGKLSNISTFNKLKKTVKQYEEIFSVAVSKANRVLDTFGTPRVYNILSLDSIKADEDTSWSNENWADNMQQAFDQLDCYMEAIDAVKDQLTAQLKLYESDHWFEHASTSSFDGVLWSWENVNPKAVEWFQNEGKWSVCHAGMQFRLGLMYEEGRRGLAQDYGQAEQWFRKAAEKRHAGAQTSLGLMYQEGRGIAQDNQQALQWFRKAAEQGHSYAQSKLGLMYQEGLGVAQDDRQAVEWFQKAAEQRDLDAQFRLGLMYLEGRGVVQDDSQAVEWFRKAAEWGYARAQFWLGFLYKEGRGVEQDDLQASEWFGKAAEQGDAEAQQLLNLGSEKS